MPRLGLVLLLIALSAGPARLAAQDRRLTERLDPVTATRVQGLVDSARALGLPTEPLVQKALEGSTMGASGERIRTAVAALFLHLGQARQALGRQASDAELTAAVGALRAGVAPADLSRLHDLRSGRSLVVPIAVLTDLVAEGVPAEQATRAVFELAREGRSDADFVALRRQAQGKGKRGPSPPEPERPPPPPAAEPPSDR